MEPYLVETNSGGGSCAGWALVVARNIADSVIVAVGLVLEINPHPYKCYHRQRFHQRKQVVMSGAHGPHLWLPDVLLS